MTIPPLFPLGRTVATQGAAAALRTAGQDAAEFLARHARGDWGEIDKHDKRQNAIALREGFRLMSVYTIRGGQRLWVIIEADRSATTLLLPDEY